LNGAGSILYYTAFSRLDASIGHLLYSFYPLFVAIWLFIDRQPVNRLTYFRLLLAIPGVTLLILSGRKSVDLLGAAMMLGAAILYALHLLVNQRVLYEVPAQTVTFYTLLSMGATVIIPYLIFDHRLPPGGTPWWPVLGMALFTFFSRITLFLGVKHLGGMQTALLGLGELLITVLLAVIWLGEQLTPVQWFGAGLLAGSLFLVGYERNAVQKRYTTGLLAWLNPPHINPTDFPWES
jgi:drug/metabolite transporter (DMT)-like permease